jgi:ferredoxin
MPLDPKTLGTALGETLTLHSTLCRREVGAFEQALGREGELVVACTQEARLFGEIAEHAEGVKAMPIRFVNIRETAGWSADAKSASPKLAALLSAAHLPEPQPVPTVTYKSAGRLLIIGALDAAERAARLLDDALDISIFSTGTGGEGGAAQERPYPMLAGRIESLTGWLGAFELTWARDNAIDLDLCTRCNACLAACPEDAIGFDYQIDPQRCQSHRVCVQACGVAGAIDFTREPRTMDESFDLVLDLRTTPAFSQHAKPQGYFHGPQLHEDPRTLIALRGLVGEFEKPKFFTYKQKLCAHSRNTKTGCNACIEVCSASAISSDKARNQIKVNPNLCVGCGACTTVCPSGALSYAYPSAAEQGAKLKTLLSTYLKAGGKAPALLLHSQAAGTKIVNELGRAARIDPAVQGLPARVMPLALWHAASTGLELWLSAIAWGARNVWVLVTDEEAPQYLDALRAQMAVAQALLNGLGYEGEHFRLLQARDARDLASLDAELQIAPASGVKQVAGYNAQADKRATLEFALAHLVEQAPLAAEAGEGTIALPAASPLGALALDKGACTMCLGCINACPAGALLDNPNAPELRFIEQNCVQCGLCVKTCPEQALTLVPQLRLGKQRKEAVVINEMQPYGCIRCGKPFGTLKAVEAMVGRLAGHAMFQGAALERLKMCGDCRVIDIHSNPGETRITDI